MILFPKYVRASSRFVLTLKIKNGYNNKEIAYYSGLSVRQVQAIVKKHKHLLNGYKSVADNV